MFSFKKIMIMEEEKEQQKFKENDETSTHLEEASNKDINSKKGIEEFMKISDILEVFDNFIPLALLIFLFALFMIFIIMIGSFFLSEETTLALKITDVILFVLSFSLILFDIKKIKQLAKISQTLIKILRKK